MVILYHRCPEFACGSIDTTIRWWATWHDGTWHLMFYGATTAERAVLHQRLQPFLTGTPAMAAATAQDARAEAPDL